jgi:tetratricopeptide (TPR) repeat protein
MADIVNPYIAGAPVTEQRMFFGREDVFHWIQNSLAGQYADHILVIHGQRRVGKTSVLKQLGNRLPKKYVPVFFDLQGRTHTTLDRFLWWLAREIVRVLKQERGIEIPVPEKEVFTADLEYFENKFLAGLRPILGEDTLLLTFDEFDNLEESEVKEELARPLVDYLRRLMGETGMSFIFSIGSSGRKLENMQASYTEFFKTALYKKISFLSRDQTSHLVAKPVEGVLEYERPAVDMIFETAFGHPYFTQLMCHELFARCQRTEQRRVAKNDVEAILDDVVERGTVNLKFVWDEASDIEKWSLAALAQLDKTDNRAVADYLKKQRVRFSETDLTSGLLHLREKDVLTSENRFVIQLLKIWLQKNRPIEQAREELTEVNPIANRYIEIGLEFKDSRLFDKAIESFQEALAISKDNVQAQVNIALTYMDQKLPDKAVVEFEKALAMDDEDVSARAGLCEAHLALGDSALARGRAKDATLSYQRVLAINAEHLEARGRMAEISRQRAEKALTDGKDEEALSAFAEALRFTPEDGSLIARAEKVRAEKKAKVLAALLARSEKEASAKSWEKSLAALSEALELAPQDESILAKIESVKARQLKDRLDAILAKVDGAEKAARWDTAISALGDYLALKPDDTAIQKRLDNLRAAKRSAWLGAVRARADAAVASERWDEAVAALNEVLSLEPENREIAARVEEVRALQKAAALRDILRRAEQAALAGRWDEAIESLNAGLASEPENETLQAKLAEVRKAKREARLKAALRLADSAAGAGKWEAAVASLNEVLANEPDNAEFQQKLAEVRAQEHESRWDAVQTQSESLREAEEFEQAIQAWQAYLSLYPEEREQVEKETKPIVQEGELFDLYTGASKSMAARDFDPAIRSLKEIIIRDENYKDASRLLTMAIESRRTGTTQKLGKPRRKPASTKPVRAPKTGGKRMWVIGGLAAILILGIGGGLFWLGKNGLPAALSSTADTKPTPKQIIPTPTQIITATPDPRILNPTNQHLYLYVQSEKTWHDARNYCSGQGGYLVTIQDAAENSFVFYLTDGWTWLGATDEIEEETWVWVSGEYVNNPRWKYGRPSSDRDYLSYNTMDSDSGPNSWDAVDGSRPFVCEWEEPADTNITTSITPILTPDPRVLNPANQHLYLLVQEYKNWHEARDYCVSQNGYLATIQNRAENLFVASQTDSSIWLGATREVDWGWVSGEPWEYTNWGVGREEGKDYLRILSWREAYYSGIGNYSGNWSDSDETGRHYFVCEWGPSNSSPTTNITPSPNPKTSAFYEPILTYIETKRWATFEDDFSTQRTEWGYDSYGHLITGQIKHQSLQIPPAQKIPSNQLLYANNFAIRFDYALVGTDEFVFRFRASPDETAYNSFIYSGGGIWDFVSNDGTRSSSIKKGEFVPALGSEMNYDFDSGADWTKIPLNNFFFIVHGDNLAVFINGDLVLEYNELTTYGNRNYMFNEMVSWFGKLDNVKFWNLDGENFDQ